MSYFFKLSCLSFAVFFIVHTAAALLVNTLVPFAIRAAGRMQASAAARFLLMVRLAPAGIALFSVAALCMPSYLRFEPDTEFEEVGVVCLVCVLLTVALLARSLWRIAVAILNTRDWLRNPVRGNTIALAGFIHPRVIVSDTVMRALSADELDAAVRHERAHAASRDNLKRMLITLAPETLPFLPARFTTIENAWKKFSEWSADDRAASGDPQQSIALASALVRVAKLGAAPAPSPLVTFLIDGDLNTRIDRLLAGPPQGSPDRWTPAMLAAAGTLAAFLMLSPAALMPVHELLELLIA